MSVINNNLLLTAAAGATGYQVSRSLRFSSGDSSYLSRTPASAGNRKTWTWSGWVKRSSIGSGSHALFGVTNSGASAVTHLVLEPDNLTVYDVLAPGYVALITTQVFRDPSAWYHIVWTCDTTQATASNRMKLYVNGTEITTFSTDNRSSFTQNVDTSVNSTNQHSIGSRLPYTGAYFSGYLADIWFLDGIAATPSDFAETDATTGQWIPKAYTGSKGTNGFHLEFADNSAATAAALGKDTSGNSPANNWTPNNLSVTAGAGNDALTDSPTSYGTGTSGGDVRGNFCVWNPLDSESGCTFANGNLEVSTNGGRVAVASFGVPTSGKWYWEGTFLGAGGTDGWIGAIPTTNRGDGSGRYYRTNGQQLIGGSWTAYGASYGQNDVIGVALDQDNNTVTFYKNGTSQGAQTSVPLRDRLAACNNDGTAGWAFNFGQRAFAYPVSGFKALVDTNLTAPVIAKPSTVMDVKLYTGNGSTQTISGLGFSPDFVWLKRRSSAQAHYLYDVIRGTSSVLYSDGTDAEQSITTGLTAFNSDGFSLGSLSGVNASSTTNVAWCWDAGTSTVTNTQGSITSSVRANASAGFSIVSWSANNTANQSIGHSLGVTPAFIIHKNRTTAGNWNCWFTGFSNDEYINLNGTGAKASTGGGLWYQTPTSSLFYVGFTGSAINNSTDAIISYCFAPVAGYSAMSSFVGNGSSEGPFCWCGFRPRFILLKNASYAGADWYIHDTATNTYNVVGNVLRPNTSGAENTYTLMDILSNGFKMRNTFDSHNRNGDTIIWAAFAESPFQYARAR